MFFIKNIFRNYTKIGRPILNIIIADFFLQLINSSFTSIQPLYMQTKGYTDGVAAGYISFRFLGILLLALPLGLLIKRKKLKPFFYVAGFGVPTFSLLIIVAIENNLYYLINIAQLGLGASFAFMQITMLPFILRTSTTDSKTESISLSFSTWSIASILGSFLIGLLNKIDPLLFSERNLLMAISLLGYLSIYFIKKSRPEHLKQDTQKEHNSSQPYNWKRIGRALIPTSLIAIGAGFTIPFISLFFSNVHHLSTSGFSYINSLAALFVAFGAIMVPHIKKTMTYKVAVPTTQSFAVLALILMATTQYYNHIPIALYIAIFCYLLRQPLMNMAGPMTSEVTMGYVGEKNRELVSALISAIWSGSWFVSSRIFKILREAGYMYVNIFLITAALYTLGIIWYYLLIKDYENEGVRVVKN